MRPNNLSDIKRANRHLLYSCIYENGTATIADLEHLTKLSRPTITNLMRDMEEEGDIVRAGMRSSTGGRSPVLFTINPEASFAIGVDFEFPVVRVAICDLEFRLVRTSKRSLQNDADMEQCLASIIDQIQCLMDEMGVDKTKYVGIGVGLPGVMDIDAGVSLIIEKISGWEKVPIVKLLSEHFHIPVYIQNDVNLLTMAERRLWPEDTMRNMLCIVIRTGIGMGVLVDDRLFNGSYGNAGRIGHMSVNFDGQRCVCGGRGCLTLYTSERAMVRGYCEHTGREVSSGNEISLLASQGDAEARSVFDNAGWYMGLAIFNLVNLFDVSNVVLLTSFRADNILSAARRALESRSGLFRKRGIRLYTGRLAEDAYAQGGCILALEHHRKGPQLRTEPT